MSSFSKRDAKSELAMSGRLDRMLNSSGMKAAALWLTGSQNSRPGLYFGLMTAKVLGLAVPLALLACTGDLIE